MALVVFEHDNEANSSRVGEILQSFGHRLRVLNLDQGDGVPQDLDDVTGVLSMGGAMNVDQKPDHPWIDAECSFIKAAHDAGLPVLGVCLGAQLVAAALGGQVAAMDEPEIGWHEVKQAFPGTIDPLLAGIPWSTTQFHLHGQQVTDLPPGSTPLCTSKQCKTQAYRVGLTTYAFQYHIEWTADELRKFAKVDMVTKAGVDPQNIIDGIPKYFDSYRRWNDRMINRMGEILFPVDR